MRGLAANVGFTVQSACLKAHTPVASRDSGPGLSSLLRNRHAS